MHRLVRLRPTLVQTRRRLVSTVSFNTPSNPTDYSAYARADASSRSLIDEHTARASPRVTTLHSRLHLDPQFAHSTLARALVCYSAQTKFVDNHGMAVFGKNLIQFYVHEHFTVKYPRLPPPVLKHVIQLYSGVNALTTVGKNMGIEEDSRPPVVRHLADEKDEQLLGKLMYSSDKVVREDGVVEILSDNKKRTDHKAAMASFVRALLAGVYAHNGLAAAKQFTQDYIIKPNRIDMASLLSFQQPTRELAVLCAREGLEAPVSRLMLETGRFSKTPVFIVGVFSGDKKLGEGQGPSLKEAKTRAAVHALKAWYLYSPVDAKLPSDGGSNQHIDQGVVIV